MMHVPQAPSAAEKPVRQGPDAASGSQDLLGRALAGQSFLLLDGALGSMLQARGMQPGAIPELLLFEDPELVAGVHEAYVEAGADVITTCTFGANARKLAGKATVAEVYGRAVQLAREAGARYVAADVGPTGALLEPLGPMSVDECEALYREQGEAIAATDADLVIIETMGDLLEAKTALIAIKEQVDIPIVCTMTFGEDGLTFLGASPEACAVTLAAAGASAVGVNCSLGPDKLVPLIGAMAPLVEVPLVCQANAGLPRMEGDASVYDLGPEPYVAAAQDLIAAGVTLVGGCCGTTDAHIAALCTLLDRSQLPQRQVEPAFTVASSQRVVRLLAAGHAVAPVGERINPTGKKRLKKALRTGDFDYLVSEALDQEDAGAAILDVNVGLPEIDEPACLATAVTQIQAVCDLPLQLDSTDPAALIEACRHYAGKPLINSVNGSVESLAAILPIAHKYGAALVGLTLDESGIPQTASERVAIAHRLVEHAQAAGIAPHDIAIDCLAMAASTNQEAPAQILKALKQVRQELPVQTMLGVSNISFGLPLRPLVNATFLAEALGAGLTLPIVNPLDPRLADVLAVHYLLNGQDAGAASYVDRYAGRTDAAPSYRETPATDAAAAGEVPEGAAAATPAQQAYDLILKGRKGPIPALASRLLETQDPLEVIDSVLIAALDEVGARFESGAMFLPQLMASAEAAGAGFDVIKAAMPKGEVAASKGRVILATVKGDIHDIGKNIVKMLLENYGFTVIDLGRDVAPEAVLHAVEDTGAHVVGLSALMTTTVKAMGETIDLLREKAPNTYVFVGGAVLNPEYAQMVGADAYAKDAAESARLLTELFEERPDLR